MQAPTRTWVVVVEGNDRWARQPVGENTLGGNHVFVVRYGDALVGVAVDSVANELVERGEVSLATYDVVVWASAEDAQTDDSVSLAEQAALRAYLDGGGSLLMSGAEIAWDLQTQGSAEEQAFLRDYLKADYAGDDAETFVARGDAGGVLADVGRVGFYTPDDMVVSFPDQLTPVGGALALMSYVGGSGGAAAVGYDGTFKMVYIGFPFESIDSAMTRRAMMTRLLGFLR